MNALGRKHLYLFFLIPAIVLTDFFIVLPDELEWDIVFFLCIMVVFDQIKLKVFSGFGYSFFHVILSLIIFDRFSIVYGVIYLLVDCLFASLHQKRGGITSRISLLSIYTIIIIICNEIYNGYSDKTYLARYATLLVMLTLSIILKYVYVYLETGTVSSKLFLDQFGPMVFEVAVIFPILSFFNELEVNLVLILFLSYYTIIGYLHKQFMSINEKQIHVLTEKITRKYGIPIFFMDLQDVKGIFSPDQKLIIVDEKMDYPEQLQTIIHELIHYQTHKILKLPKKIEEVIITFFEAIFSWYYIITINYHSKME
ncbi:hypothetical protein [Bacillus sp. FJAT-29814]|uniref:hypothetical protein n=1 Tax=Bacillus sp. FJAT-29814 TaxID=1729688 RepID=UPI0008321FDD|nr:hypothetical protein [Bacillus sp. FJAT-29814]